MKPLTLAILSDLHVGRGARATDLCPDPDPKDPAPDANYIDGFTAFVKTKSITADYLVIPGDISHRARPVEFQLASKTIDRVAEALGIGASEVLLVPGNHDVDWAVLKLSSDDGGFRKSQRYDPFAQPSLLFARALRGAHGDLLHDPHFCSWDRPDLLAIGYNSSWHDDPDVAVHHGLIANTSVDAIEQYLTTVNLSDDRLRLFIVHHHPVQYSDPIATEADFSAMTNAPRLLRTLQAHRFDLLIHGHKHNPHFQTEVVDSGFPLALLAAGSFSVRLDTRWSGHVNNQFHIIRVETRDDRGCVCGLVESYTYLCGHGWRPSEPANGILHRLPFGSHVHPNDVRRQIDPLVQASLQRQGWADWQGVTSALPALRFLPAPAVNLAVQGLAEEHDLILHHAGSDNPLLLLRKA